MMLFFDVANGKAAEYPSAVIKGAHDPRTFAAGRMLDTAIVYARLIRMAERADVAQDKAMLARVNAVLNGGRELRTEYRIRCLGVMRKPFFVFIN